MFSVTTSDDDELKSKVAILSELVVIECNSSSVLAPLHP